MTKVWYDTSRVCVKNTELRVTSGLTVAFTLLKLPYISSQMQITPAPTTRVDECFIHGGVDLKVSTIRETNTLYYLSKLN